MIMKVSSMMLLLLLPPPPLLLVLLSLQCQPSNSAIILVGGVSEWKNPTVYIGDSISRSITTTSTFSRTKEHSMSATSLKPHSSPNQTPSPTRWNPSLPGFFYFTFHNGSLSSCNQDSKKLSIEVSPPPPSLPPLSSPLPAPISGGVVPSSPSFPWPFHPKEAAVHSSSSSSSPAPGPMPLVPDKVGGSNGNIPFINSNPAVPLPTGEVDSATVRPLPTSTSGFSPQAKVGLLGVQMTPTVVVLLLLPLVM